LDFKARTGSAREATFQRVINMPLTSCLFQQAALSNHGRFKPDLRPFIWTGTCTSRKSTFGCRQVKLSVVQAAFVNVIARNSIDTPVHKPGTFCFPWAVKDDLYIDGYPEEICTKYVEMDGFHW